MNKPVEITLDFRNKRFQQAATGLQYLAGQMEKGVGGFGHLLSEHLKTHLKREMATLAMKHSTPYPGGTSSKSLSRRSGRGVTAIKNAATVFGGTTINSVYAELRLPREVAVHEHGAVITPKRAKYLTIPLDAALNSNGTPKKRSARMWSNTFVGTSKKGNLLIFQKTAGGIIPLYALKKSVKIPPRLGLVDHTKAGLPRFIDRAFEIMLESLIMK